ncbi:MAG TPA: endonuclease/exonuclease/phosphatase family protein [Trebonia sp.]|nr:endonuclease/exonuclease/phosphatase family protein [Trebonia sp.]
MSTLRIMTYNMLHAPGDRLGHLADVVRGVGPDVLACQEISTYEGMMSLSRELGMLPVWGPASSHEDTRDGQPLYEHLVVLTRLPPRTVRVHRGDRRAMFRPVLEVALETPDGGTVTFFVVHLRAVVDPAERYLKWRELGALLAVIAGASGPVVALGDFNALPPGELPETGGRRDLPEDHRAALGGGVVAAITGAGLADSLRLVHPYKGTPDSTLLHGAGARVDYIFVSDDLREAVTGAYIVDNEAAAAASDHRPVVAELTLANS